MKGMQGLIVAVVLGVIAVVLNWMYLDKKANEFDSESFIGIAPDTIINPGDVFQDGHFVEVPIPRGKAATLRNIAMSWNLLSTVRGANATKQYTGNELLLQKELETPPQELSLAANEQAFWVPIDQRSSIPNFITPGDEVTFMIRKVRPPATSPPPVPDAGDGQTPPTTTRPAPEPIGYTDYVGPFKVLSVGNRLGKPNVLNAAHVTQMQENVITVPIKYVGGVPDPLSQKLIDALTATGFRDVGITLKKAKKQ